MPSAPATPAAPPDAACPVEQQLIQLVGRWTLALKQAMGAELLPPGADLRAAAKQGQLGRRVATIGHGNGAMRRKTTSIDQPTASLAMFMRMTNARP